MNKCGDTLSTKVVMLRQLTVRPKDDLTGTHDQVVTYKDNEPLISGILRRDVC